MPMFHRVQVTSSSEGERSVAKIRSSERAAGVASPLPRIPPTEEGHLVEVHLFGRLDLQE